MTKSKLLKLAKLIKCVQEVGTDNGVLVAEDTLAVGIEVFVADVDGNLIPAPDGQYTAEDLVYTVESGVITAIEEKASEESVEETPAEEVTETEEVKVEGEDATEEVAEEVTEETPAEEEDEKDKEIEELKARIAELETENETLKAENEELKKKLDEPVAEPIEEQTIAMSRQEKEDKAIANLAKAIKK